MTKPKPHALVIDDHPLICSMLRRELRSRFVVEIAHGGAEAIEQIAGGRPYELILCDLLMPQVSGIDVIDVVERQRPELLTRIVCMTGGAYTADDARRLAAIGAPLLHKPFDGAELLQVVLKVTVPDGGTR